MPGTATWSHPHKQVTALSSSGHRSPTHASWNSLHEHAKVSCAAESAEQYLTLALRRTSLREYLQPRTRAQCNHLTPQRPVSPRAAEVPVSTGMEVPLRRR